MVVSIGIDRHLQTFISYIHQNPDGKNSTNINKTNNLLSPLSPGLEQALPCGGV
jgi:hypothetical protein